jgi:hypothetical protein
MDSDFNRGYSGMSSLVNKKYLQKSAVLLTVLDEIHLRT